MDDFKCFELVLIGFDGGTDETDDLIIWVMSTSEEDVRTKTEAVSAKIRDVYYMPNDADPASACDFDLRTEGQPEALCLKINDLVK